jgi:hypothetical protein
MLFVLPVPVFVPVPVWINPPPYVAPPPGNVIFNNIHNTTVINNNANVINPGAPGRPTLFYRPTRASSRNSILWMLLLPWRKSQPFQRLC